MNKSRGLKIGVVGVGTMGRHHARICFHHLPGAQLVGIVDPDKDRATEVARLYRCPVFDSLSDLLAEVEAIIIASPTETHYETALACLNAGRHLLVEKPLAKTAEEAQELVKLSKEKGTILAVGLIERFNPAFVELSKLIKKEKILGIDIKRFSPFPERITDANVVQDMMIHDLDLLASLLPHDEIEELKVEGKKVKTDKLDTVSATFYYKSGIIAKVAADRVFGAKTRKIVVTAESGLFEADLLNKSVYVRDLKHHAPSVHHTKSYDQLTAELADFVKAIKSSSKPKVDAESGYQAIKLAEEVEKICS